MVDTGSLYKLPWTRDNNPNGWLEPTTYCQLKCPFCYRGVDENGFNPTHMDFADVKKEVDDLIRLRQVATITIAGGDPFMYPQLDETIDYIRAQGVDVMLLTNGKPLNEKVLARVRDRGVARVVVHIDKYQGREGIKTEDDANRLRQELCDLFRKVGGISLGFALPIGPDDLDDLEVLIAFFKKNADVVDLVNFNRMEPTLSRQSTETRVLDATTLFERVSQAYGIDYCAHLGKTRSDEISWLFGQAIFSGDELIGSLDGNAFRFIQKNFYEKTKRSGTKASVGGHTTPKFFAYLPFNKSLRKMLFRYVGLNGKRGKINLQLVLVINSPTKKNGEWDVCKGCPDAMMYQGKLIPSCLLERVKTGEFIEAG
jgi:pyruvate-formate lyase-activating enzyme